MRNREICEALGLSKGTVSALISRGMPATNLGDIRLWREAHLRLRPKHERTPPSAATTPIARATARTTSPGTTAALHHATSQLTALERLQQSEQQLSDDIETWTISLQEAINEQRPIDQIESRLALLRKEHAAAVKSLLAAQKQSLEIAVRRGELITAEASESYTAAVLLPAIAAIRGMARYGANEVEKTRLAEISTMILDTMRESSATAAAMR